MKIALAYVLHKHQATLSTITVEPSALVAVTELLDKRFPTNDVVKKFNRNVCCFIEDDDDSYEGEAHTVSLSYSDMRKMLPELFQIGHLINEIGLTLLDGNGNRNIDLPTINAYHSFMLLITHAMRENVKTSFITLTEIY